MAATLRKQILVGYGIGLALIVVLLAWAILNLVNLGQASDAILRENYRSIQAAENMIDSIERQDSATLLVMLDYDAEGQAQFHENEDQFLQWMARAKGNITISGEADILASVESGYSAYLANFSKLRELRKSAPPKAGQFYHESVLPSFTQVRDAAVRLRDINQRTMFAASRRASQVAERAIWSTLVVAAAAIGLGLGFSLLLSKRLVRPIRQMIRATEALAEGDYDIRALGSGSEELAHLAEDFNVMAEKLGRYHRLNVERIMTEKHKSDAVLASIEDGVMLVDSQFCLTNINRQAGIILGVKPEEALDRPFLDVVKNEQLLDLVRQTARSGRPPQVEEGRDILTLGDEEAPRHYLVGITPVVGDGGGLSGVVLLLRDVTRMKELERMKSEFVMAASHELKTPLQSLGMSIELLREAPARLDAKQRQLLDAAGEEVGRLRSMVSDLLDLSRIEAGKVEMEFDRVPPAQLVDKAVEVFKEQAWNKRLELIGDVPPEIPQVRADVSKITWVLTNLIGNALRYARTRITVSARHGGHWVYLAVEDDGEGIPLEYQSRIFEKFAQVASAKTVGGTGLGLSICKEIVRAHKGTIWLDSTPGKGTVFTFTLPLAGQEQEIRHGR
ncbi:MAG: HAMP domain-containing protein [Planctomycetaceae bacterium]|nr:HAMP domain-containing protein [Planctomycetaceae bacterium]